MQSSKLSFLTLALAAVIPLAACGGPSSKQIKELNNITVDLPSGWTIIMNNYGKGTVAEINAKGFGRVLRISEAQHKAESLEMLEKAMSKELTATNGETLPNGFGGAFQRKSDGKKYPLYVINAGGRTYNCEAGPYYKEEALEESSKVCKSIR